MLQALAMWPQPFIAHLSSDNGIGVEGAKELANGLMKNSTLTSLDLWSMPSFPAACMTAPCPSDFVMHFYKSLWPWRWHGVLLEYGVWCQCMFFVLLFLFISILPGYGQRNQRFVFPCISIQMSLFAGILSTHTNKCGYPMLALISARFCSNRPCHASESMPPMACSSQPMHNRPLLSLWLLGAAAGEPSTLVFSDGNTSPPSRLHGGVPGAHRA